MSYRLVSEFTEFPRIVLPASSGSCSSKRAFSQNGKTLAKIVRVRSFILIAEVGISYPHTYTAHLLICNQLDYRKDWPADYHSDSFILAN